MFADLFQSSLLERITSRNAKLKTITSELKTELFGIDAAIDRVIDSLRAWYVLPEIMTRPVIVCLWGLTGTGKTQLTRSLAKKLDFYNRFVEVQMDGFSHGHRNNTISGMLSSSGIDEGAPGILVLDEFQRYRTIDSKGDDIRVERYMDVWTLLSDGRLPPALSFVNELEMSIAAAQYKDERKRLRPATEGNDDDIEVLLHSSSAPVGRFSLSPHEAAEFKETLKLKEPILEIMGWSAHDVLVRMQAFRDQPGAWETDYSKLLIFVCGNLDEMYQETAKRVEDCDTDADIFHALTSRLSIIDVKRALASRFKPEQVARLGNNHVVYPSFSRATYEKLIDSTVSRCLADIEKTAGLRFTVSEGLKAEIYANAVFPAQGTRPVFSSIHGLLSAPLVNFTLWALANGAVAGNALAITVDPEKRHLLVRWRGLVQATPVSFDINALKLRTDPDFRTLLAVHEAGHGLVYALLFAQAPQELKINVATFSGGYNSYNRLKAQTRKNVLDEVCVSLAGRAAEVWVFGDEAATTGGEQDLAHATEQAARFFRYWGFGNRLSRTDVSASGDENLNTDVASTNGLIEAELHHQFNRAKTLLESHREKFVRIVETLVAHGEVSSILMNQWFDFPGLEPTGVTSAYAYKYASFSSSVNNE